MRRMALIACCVVLCVTGSISAKDTEIAFPREIVGHGIDHLVQPDLGQSVSRAGGSKVWTHLIQERDAVFVRVHFVNVNLAAGERITLRSRTGHVVEEITGRGPKGLGTFWSLSAFGEEMLIEYTFNEERTAAPFHIDKILVGDVDPFGQGDGIESICNPADFEDVICYQGDAGKWANVMASVGVMSVGGQASGEWCSGSLVSPNNYALTNWHCIPDYATCDNAEFIFKYYRTGCNDGSPPTADWVSYRCDQTVVQAPIGDCDATLSTLDFSLNSIIGDPASTFGWVTPDPNPLTSGEAIYIIQHPDGRPHEITHGDGANVVVDGTVLRYYDTLDTEGGSSGSPIFRESDDKMVGLHHCGGCETAGTGNRGMMMSDIYPLISSYLCTASVTLKTAPHAGLTEVNGNGNSVVEPGETWSFMPKVRNMACADTAGSVSADLRVSPSSVTPVTLGSSSASFGDIIAGAAAEASAAVEFTVGHQAACGGTVLIDLDNLQASGVGPFDGADGYVEANLGTKPLTSLLFEDFTSGIPVTWTVVDGSTGGGAAATWTTDNPGGRSLSLTAPFAIVDSDEAGSSVTQDEELISPIIDATGYAELQLQFAHDFNWYSSGGDEQADVDIRSSLTGGAWVTVTNFSGADTSGTVNVDITAQAAGASDVQIRFHYYDGSYDYWWAVDDITVFGANGYVCESTDGIFFDGFENGNTDRWDYAGGITP